MKENLTIKKREIYCLALITILFLFRTIIPFLKYLFLAFFLLFLIYSLIVYRERIKVTVKALLKLSPLIFLNLMFLIFWGIFSDKLYILVVKDLINIIFLLLLFLNLLLVVTTIESLKTFLKTLTDLIIVFALIFSLLDLLNLSNILSYKDYFKGITFLNSSFADMLLIDSNFALIPVFFGMFALLFCFKPDLPRFRIVILNLLLMLFAVKTGFSGSRRGLVVLLIFFMLFVVIYSGLSKDKLRIFDGIRLKPGIFLTGFLSVLIIFNSFIFIANVNIKDRTFRYLGINKESFQKSEIASKIYRYSSIFKRDISYFDFYNLFWSIKFDPKDPDSGWGRGRYKTIYPLTGENAEIVPSGAIGYMLDSTCFREKSNDHIYSFTLIGNSRVKSDDIVKASVFCFVSNEFNGDLVSIYSEGCTEGKTKDDYDLRKKSVWQKLDISTTCNTEDAPVFLYFSKFGVTDFTALNGFVIFAYPQYELLSKEEEGSPQERADYQIKYPNNDTMPGNYDFLGNAFGKGHYKISSGSHFETASISLLSNKIRLFSFIGNSKTFTNRSSFNSAYLDPLRNLINKILAEDTTYNGYTTTINVKIKPAYFENSRLSRWQFAWQIYIKEYTWVQKTFGGGFNFLNWYGYYFSGDKTKSDYPHNPFLHVLLYSGIIGLILYIYLICKVFFLYFKYRNHYPLLLIFFLIVFFFTFFSGGSPFDPPVMGFFVILPFFIHYIHEKDQSENAEE